MTMLAGIEEKTKWAQDPCRQICIYRKASVLITARVRRARPPTVTLHTGFRSGSAKWRPTMVSRARDDWTRDSGLVEAWLFRQRMFNRSIVSPKPSGCLVCVFVKETRPPPCHSRSSSSLLFSSFLSSSLFIYLFICWWLIPHYRDRSTDKRSVLGNTQCSPPLYRDRTMRKPRPPRDPTWTPTLLSLTLSSSFRLNFPPLSNRERNNLRYLFSTIEYRRMTLLSRIRTWTKVSQTFTVPENG